MNTRIRQIIEYYGYTTHSFEQKILVSQGTIGKMLGGKISLKTETILKICANFPDISLDWLLLGKGEMLRTETPESTIEKPRQIQAEINNNSDYIRELMETQAKYLKLLEKENERLLRQIDELKQRK